EARWPARGFTYAGKVLAFLLLAAGTARGLLLGTRPAPFRALLAVLVQAPLTLLHHGLLGRGGLLLVLVEGVGTAAELHPHRRALQVEGLPEHTHQVALVGVRRAVQLVAVHHDHRRVAPALVGIAQLDAAARHHGWLVLHRGRLHHPGQFGGAHL